MRVLVCGGRDFRDGDLMWNTLDFLHETHKFSVLIHGGAAGADIMGSIWAEERGIPRIAFPAQWKTHGKAAGPIRNQQMLDEGKPDIVVAFPGGIGTRDMVTRTQKAGVRLVVVNQPTVRT